MGFPPSASETDDYGNKRSVSLKTWLLQQLGGVIDIERIADRQSTKIRWEPPTGPAVFCMISDEQIDDAGFDIGNFVKDMLLQTKKRAELKSAPKVDKMFGQQPKNSRSIGYGATVYTSDGKPIGRISSIEIRNEVQPLEELGAPVARGYLSAETSITIELMGDMKSLTDILIGDQMADASDAWMENVNIPVVQEIAARFIPEEEDMPLFSAMEQVQVTVGTERAHKKEPVEPYSIVDFIEEEDTPKSLREV